MGAICQKSKKTDEGPEMKKKTENLEQNAYKEGEHHGVPPSSSQKGPSHKAVKIGVVFYSTYGHCYKLAKKVAEGAKSAGAEVEIRRIKETLSDEILGKMGGLEARKEWLSIPEVTPEDVKRWDGMAIGGPTRFGMMSAQAKTFLDSLGGLWMEKSTVGKFATIFGCSGTQHGGNETTLVTTMIPLFHLGFAVVGLPYSFAGQFEAKEIVGGSPYGMTTVTLNNKKEPIAVELEGAAFQGKHLVEVMTKYSLKK